jgi:hypothetical protein
MAAGFAASYGIFQEYYSTHAPFAGESNIAVVGACAMVSTVIFLYTESLIILDI